MEASLWMGLERSQTSPFTLDASMFLAKPAEMDWAICIEVIPSSYCLTAPSGNVILIMLFTK